MVGHQVVGKLQGLWGVPGCRGDAAAFVFATGGQPHIRGLGLATDPKTFVRRTVRRLKIERGPPGRVAHKQVADWFVREYGGVAPPGQPGTG